MRPFYRRLVATSRRRLAGPPKRSPPRACPSGTEVLVGEPAREVVRLAMAKKADLVVMGSHKVNRRAQPGLGDDQLQGRDLLPVPDPAREVDQCLQPASPCRTYGRAEAGSNRVCQGGKAMRTGAMCFIGSLVIAASLVAAPVPGYSLDDVVGWEGTAWGMMESEVTKSIASHGFHPVAGPPRLGGPSRALSRSRRRSTSTATPTMSRFGSRTALEASPRF